MTKRIFGVVVLFFSTILSSYALTLEEAIQETIKRNPDVLITEKDRLAIEQALKQAKAGYLPKVKLNAGVGVESTENSTTVASESGPHVGMTRKETSLTVDQILFDGFATPGEVARNAARVTSAQYKTLATMNDLIQRCIEDYIAVVKEEELVKLAEINLASHEKIAKMIEERTLHGVSRLADLFQAKGRLSLARSNLLAELSNLKDAKTNFYRTTGLEAESLTPLSAPSVQYLPESETQAIEVAVKTNPTIKSSEADIEAAIEQHRVAKATNFPRLDLQLGMTQDRDTGGTRGPSNNEFAMLRMSYDLFSGGANLGRQRETAYLEQQAKEIRQRAIRQLVEAVKLTWSSLTTAKDQLQWLQSHQEHAEKTIGAYHEQFQVGQRQLLDLLDSENEVFASKRSYVNGKYEVLTTEYRILKEMGLLPTALNIQGTSTDTISISAPAPAVIEPTTTEALPVETPIESAAVVQAPEQPAELVMASQPEEPIPAPAVVEAPVATVTEWLVQVGSFDTQEQARKLSAKLNTVYDNAFTVKKDQHWTVQLGRFQDPKNATALANKLRNTGHEAVIVEVKK